MSSYEDLLVDMGQFGRWQAVCVVVLWIPPLFAGVHNLLFVFTGHIWQGRASSLFKINNVNLLTSFLPLKIPTIQFSLQRPTYSLDGDFY